MTGTPPSAPREPASLFLDITTITVDPAYVEAAARHASTGPPPRRTRLANATAFVAALALLGLLVGVAARQTRLRAPAAARLRDALVTEAERRTSASERLRRTAEELREETAAARDRRLQRSAAGRQLAERLAGLELVAGGFAVTGPGIEVRLSNAGDAGSGPADEGKIRDVDLQQVVNALWAAGAEAVAINDSRLVATTPIRSAGGTIVVNFRPLSPPFTVSAIGADRIAFEGSDIAKRFRRWTELFGLGFSVRDQDAVKVPAFTGRVTIGSATPGAS